MKCKKIILMLSLIVIFNNQCVVCGVFSIIRELLQWNVAGIPIIHQKYEYDFDPQVSVARREKFYELHGFRATKYLERIGQGIDGKHQERAYQNAVRDEGRLQGLNLLTP